MTLLPYHYSLRISFCIFKCEKADTFLVLKKWDFGKGSMTYSGRTCTFFISYFSHFKILWESILEPLDNLGLCRKTIWSSNNYVKKIKNDQLFSRNTDKIRPCLVSNICFPAFLTALPLTFRLQFHVYSSVWNEPYVTKSNLTGLKTASKIQ